jgi:hypothetical protein
MDDIRVFGYCACCGNEITDADEEYYVNDNGETFCSAECVCESYGLTKVEI